ncbi:Thioesterase superfamily [Corchorus capsularis]|uniref:Acyl-coenzyme A thioesterase 13 n=1 Tax=Corchorus capsularis TaxID=210143 RepID=A0A1R3G7P4_COCAP|nr:Thioesterase superfamily [Corchorus capsularis]
MEKKLSSMSPEVYLKWAQEALSKGIAQRDLDNRAAQGIQILQLQKGFVRCNFIVPATALDANGKWHVGAIATIIDTAGAIAVYSENNRSKVVTDYNISYYSTAKIQDEIEIEGRVVANKGKLTSVMVEVRRKDNGELIATGKQWTASNDFRAPLGQPSKL